MYSQNTSQQQQSNHTLNGYAHTGIHPLPITIEMITTTADNGENGHEGSAEAGAIRQAGKAGYQ
eukprot:4063680-Amphidinium_carterae.1